jgi:hypothetical protein
MTTEAKTGLALLREPFPPHQISKLPKPTKQQTEEVKADYKKGIRCEVCGAWHHPKVVHLDYVGHAALTDRLLDADPGWGWEPLAIGPDGLPKFDSIGGLWIKLTVCGVVRMGYGNAENKTYSDVGAREKEVIGDALRNAGMRFGAALDLWHKGDLHVDADDSGPAKTRGGVMEAVLKDAPQQSADDALYFKELAAELEALFVAKGQAPAFERVSIEGLDNDQSVYLWSLLGSKIRSALKTEKGLRVGAA